MLHIALFEPRIAPNTGNIIRLAANNGCHLHLIEPLGFSLEDKQLRRAGLDYHDLAHVTRHADYDEFSQALNPRRILACTTRGTVRYDQMAYRIDDVLLFGNETSGLPQSVHDEIADAHKIVLPMKPSNRSLNLSNAVAIISYEVWRQLDFVGL
jgi:tRNA (cytidine/uridine-2'-O-)-methyltransferase